jgi:hypothetical protein
MINKDDEKILVIFLIYYTMNKSSLTIHFNGLRLCRVKVQLLKNIQNSNRMLKFRILLTNCNPFKQIYIKSLRSDIIN